MPFYIVNYYNRCEVLYDKNPIEVFSQSEGKTSVFILLNDRCFCFGLAAQME